MSAPDGVVATVIFWVSGADVGTGLVSGADVVMIISLDMTELPVTSAVGMAVIGTSGVVIKLGSNFTEVFNVCVLEDTEFPVVLVVYTVNTNSVKFVIFLLIKIMFKV